MATRSGSWWVYRRSLSNGRKTIAGVSWWISPVRGGVQQRRCSKNNGLKFWSLGCQRSRVNEANRIHAEKKNCIYVSVHANAFGNGKEFNKAKGICTFYYYKSSKGEVLAESLQRWLADLTPFRDRGIRANDTWANFYVLRKTHMPAVLSENGFMTNFDDAINLMDPNVRQDIANAHYNMMLEIEENGL